MISYKIISEKGIVIIEPSGPLQQKDFENLAEGIDDYISRNGKLDGLIIHAKSFPGWEDFGAFIHHMKFIKGHHREIKRVAAAIDSKIMSIIPKIANHFVLAEVKHFAYDDIEAAKEWVQIRSL